MNQTKKIYILGAGAIGLALSCQLAGDGRDVVLVRTGRDDISSNQMIVTLYNDVTVGRKFSIESVSLSKLTELNGIVVLTAKSYANKSIASVLQNKKINGPLVIMQNGIGVETPFFESQFKQIFRCVLYATAQTTAENEIIFRSIASSPIGIVRGDEFDLKKYVELLTTGGFPFHSEMDIQRDIWKKTIINVVFNSICPLLEIDNGVFTRDQTVIQIAREIIGECIILARSFGLSLTESELFNQVLQISNGSNDILISTLQDINNGRETEIESLNLELARIASSPIPSIDLRQTELLGKLVLAKSNIKAFCGASK